MGRKICGDIHNQGEKTKKEKKKRFFASPQLATSLPNPRNALREGAPGARFRRLAMNYSFFPQNCTCIVVGVSISRPAPIL